MSRKDEEILIISKNKASFQIAKMLGLLKQTELEDELLEDDLYSNEGIMGMEVKWLHSMKMMMETSF